MTDQLAADDVTAQGASSTDTVATFEQELAAARLRGDRHAVAYQLARLGVAYGILDQFQEAIACFEEALTIYREIGDLNREAAVLHNLGIAYYSQGDIKKAIQHHDAALTIAQTIADRQREGECLYRLGLAHLAAGDESRAADCFERALAAYKDMGDQRGEARVLKGLGMINVQLGEIHQALEYYTAAHRIFHELGDRLAEAEALNRLGEAYVRLPDSRMALAHRQKASEIFRELGDPRGEVTPCPVDSFDYSHTYEYSGTLFDLDIQVLNLNLPLYETLPIDPDVDDYFAQAIHVHFRGKRADGLVLSQTLGCIVARPLSESESSVSVSHNYSDHLIEMFNSWAFLWGTLNLQGLEIRPHGVIPAFDLIVKGTDLRRFYGWLQGSAMPRAIPTLRWFFTVYLSPKHEYHLVVVNSLPNPWGAPLLLEICVIGDERMEVIAKCTPELLPNLSRLLELICKVHDAELVGGMLGVEKQLDLEEQEPHQSAKYLFRKLGEFWEIRFDGDPFYLSDIKGLSFVAYLLGNPGKQVHVCELEAAIEGSPPDSTPEGFEKMSAEEMEAMGMERSFGGSRQALADPQYRSEVKDELVRLRKEMERAAEAEEFETAERRQDEYDMLTDRMKAISGLGGRSRQFADRGEQLRSKIRHQITAAFEKIGIHNGSLQQHLVATIKTGFECSYSPDSENPISWSVEM